MDTFRTRLAHKVVLLKEDALASSTKSMYASFRKSFLQFCELAGYCPVPTSSQMVCEYIAYLSERLSYSSIRKYIGIIRILHEEVGLKDPKVTDMYDVKLILLAVKKLLGDAVVRKKPVDPDLLLKMYSCLALGCEADVIVWAITLLGFFGLLRVSNMLGISGDSHDPLKFLSRQDFELVDSGFLITLRWAKNNQFRDRIVRIPIPYIKGHVLCPVTAILRAFNLTSEVKNIAPAFHRHARDGSLLPVTYKWFSKRLLEVIGNCGQEKKLYGTHSLRRGGASWALKCGLNADVIRLLGDWKSNAYQCYLEVPLPDKIDHMAKFADMVKRCG